MSFESKNATATWFAAASSYEIPPSIRFWLFLIFDILATICTIFVLYHLLTRRKLRRALHNHAIIVLLLLALIYEVIDIPLHLQYLYTGVVRPSTPFLCLVWWFIDWGFFYAIAILLLFASVERHVLIFHSHLVASKRRRFLFHYLPFGSTLAFVLIFYIVAIFTPICESTFDYTEDLCGVHACYGSIPFFLIVEQVVFSGASSCLIALFSVALLFRVLWQKYRMHQVIRWRKQRKLSVQMISLSLLYLTFALPNTIVYLVRLYGQSHWGDSVLPSFFFLSYFAVLLLPYVCLGYLPELLKRIKRCGRRRNRIGAQTELIVR